MRRLLLTIIAMVTLQAVAQDSLKTAQDSLQTPLETSQAVVQDSVPAVKPEKKLSWLRRTIRGFSYIDTNYVEPQHYNWSVMAQATYNYDYYRLSSKGEHAQSISFAPEPTVKVGPYFGWRWVFLGYTFDLRNLEVGKKEKQELDLSIYAAQLGVDFFYQRTVDNYTIRSVDLGKEYKGYDLKGKSFDGLSVGITGANVYYIFNHQRFSYPAAFAQSTRQKISCGSWMAGVGYLRNSLEFDYQEMENLLTQQTQQQVRLDSGLMFNSVRYYNVNASVGYAYNWVFARNCLFCSSLSVALAYKKSRGMTADDDKTGFDFNNFNIDGIGRFGIVYNNNRWYAGASAIVRAYNYHTSRFAANNIFGSLNIYLGFNFGARAAYKKKRL